MDGSLVTALGLGPEVWLFLSLLACVTLFFKFSRVWSVRNLDLLLLFALVPGMLLIVGNPQNADRGRRTSGCSSGRACGSSAACSTWDCHAGRSWSPT